MSRKVFLSLAVLVTVIVLSVQAVWAVMLPGFRSPDEPHHLNSILRIADGNGWPDPGAAMVDPQIMQASEEAGLIVPGAEGFAYVPDRRLLTPPGSGLASFYDFVPVAQPDRSVIGEIAAADPDATVRDQMTQHPPLYYGIGAVVVKALDLDQLPWDRLLLALRGLSLLLAAPLIPSLMYATRRLGGSREVALLAGLLPLGIPQVTAISAGVSNDAPAIGFGALALAAMTKAATEPYRTRNVVLVGLTVGLALWTKGQLLALGLPLILVFALLPGATLRQRLTGVFGAGVLSQIVCPWWLINIFRYGAIQPDGFQRTPLPDWDPAMASTDEFWGRALPDISGSFVGKFGWLESVMPMWFYVLVIALLTVATVWGFVCARRHALAPAAFFAGIVGLLVLLFRQSWSVYVETGQVAGLQGRYIFPLLVAFAVVFVGVGALGRIGYLLTALVMVVANIAGLCTMLRDFYPGSPVDLQRAGVIVGLDPSRLVVLLAAYVVAMIVILVGAWVLGSRSAPSRSQR